MAETSRRKQKITMDDIPQIFKPGMEILVQVAKAPISTKGARVTTDISIPGRFLVLMPYSEHLGLSSKIESVTERERLQKILEQLDFVQLNQHAVRLMEFHTQSICGDGILQNEGLGE